MNLHPLLSIGMIFLSGLILSGFLRRFQLPSVTSYLLLGIIAGPFCINIISAELIAAGGLLSTLVLSFISFSIGQNFSAGRLRELGKPVLFISLGASLAAAVLAGAAVYAVTRDTFYALAFAAIAPATAPAAIVMVVRELRAKGKFTDTLLGIVAFDDVWGLMIFALIISAARGNGRVSWSLLHGLIEIFGAVLLGMVMGFLFKVFSKFVAHTSELMIYTLGFILLNTGLSMLLNVSVLLSSMALAAVLVNTDRTSFRFFDILRKIDSPYYLLFFVLAGASLELNLLSSMGLVGGVYIVARLAGKILGAWLGAELLKAPKLYGRYVGISLAPQAGVALGMAMIVNKYFPEAGGYVLSTIIATTVIYELFGPVLTRTALVKAGEVPSGSVPAES